MRLHPVHHAPYSSGAVALLTNFRRSKAGLHVPKRETLHCGVPGCGKEFPMDQEAQWARHISACAKRNHDRIEAVVHEHRNNELKSITDREQYDFLRKRATERKEMH